MRLAFSQHWNIKKTDILLIGMPVLFRIYLCLTDCYRKDPKYLSEYKNYDYPYQKYGRYILRVVFVELRSASFA